MKSSKKVVWVFLAVIAAFCGLCAACTSLSFAHIREHSNAAAMQLIANVREKYPAVSDSDITEILRGNADTAQTRQMLKVYGITDEDWVIMQSEGDGLRTVAAAAAFCAACGFACIAVFAVYLRRQKQKSARLANYLAQVNSGNYDLKLDENREDDDSLLQNEIYKTTVMLRETAQRSREGKESLKDALSDISHQLKTPLTSVLIMTENLLDNPDMPEELRLEFLRDIRQSSNNISFLVQSLLTLSKLDADSITLKSKPEELSGIFSDVAQNVAVLAELHGVNVSADSGGVTLSCDRKWLGEALSNIVKNCVEHTPEGGKVALVAKDNKLYTKITVSDNGQGIDPADLPHIFERFYKGKNADENSVGIGLALSKAIVEKAGGYITADSALGKGSRFTVRFFHRP